MAVVRWDPWGEMAALQRDVSELLGQTMGAERGRGRFAAPPIDAYRTDQGLVVHADLPGVRPEDVEVSVQDGMLTIKGEWERSFEQGVESENWLRRERLAGSFERSFTLPEGTNPQEIKASFEHGVLKLEIPHPPEAKPHRVQIAGGKGAEETVDVTESQRQRA